MDTTLGRRRIHISGFVATGRQCNPDNTLKQNFESVCKFKVVPASFECSPQELEGGVGGMFNPIAVGDIGQLRCIVFTVFICG